MKVAVKKWKKLKTVCSVFLLLAVLLAGCQKKMDFQDYLDLGEKYLTEANYEEAIVAFTKAIEIDPKQAAAYEKRAEVYTARIQAGGVDDVSQWTDEIRGFYASGEADYLIAIELEPKTAGNYEKLAELYLLAGETEKAVDILKKGYEETGDEALDKRRQEIEASQITSTVDPSVYNGSMTMEMYMIMPYPEYFGKEVNTYDGMGRMTSFEWYDFDGTVSETYYWKYDDEAGKTYEESSEVYYEGIETESGKENGQEVTGAKGTRMWNSTQEIDGCKDQARYRPSIGSGSGNPPVIWYAMTDPTKKPENGKIHMENEQYATYEYDSLGRVSAIHSYTSGGEETGYCIITYSSGE